MEIPSGSARSRQQRKWIGSLSASTPSKSNSTAWQAGMGQKNKIAAPPLGWRGVHLLIGYDNAGPRGHIMILKVAALWGDASGDPKHDPSASAAPWPPPPRSSTEPHPRGICSLLYQP